MTTIAFDTLAYVKTLRDAGVEEKQAEAQATALATVLKSGAGDLATGRDLTELRTLIKQDIVRWWKETVSVRHGLNRHSVESADRGTLAMPDAESMTGISNQQVSRWRKKLVDASKYEAELFEAAVLAVSWLK